MTTHQTPDRVPFPTLDDPCFQLFDSSEADQGTYMEYLFTKAQALNADLVVWWSLRDYLFQQILTSCPCEAPLAWCALYDVLGQVGLLGAWMMWGSMGLVDHDGQAKQALTTWMNWLARPIAH